MPRTNRPRSSRINSYLDDKHYRASPAVDKLTANDMKRLAQIARGQDRGAVWGERVKAVGALSARKGSSQNKLLGSILADARDEPRVRAAAANALGGQGGSSAEDALLASLGDEDPVLLAMVLKSLGRIGTPRSLTRLARLPRHPAQFVNRQRDLAEMLIAYRHGIDADPIPFKKVREQPPSPHDETLKTAVRVLSGKQVTTILRAHRDTRYGLTLSPNLAFQIDTGGRGLVLVLNRDVAKQPLLGALFHRRFVVGLALRLNHESGTYSTRLVIFSRPLTTSEAQLLGIRNDGEPVLAGRLRSGRDGVSFVLSDVERPGTARMRIAGTLGPRGVATEASTVYARRSGKRRTADVVLPRP